MTQTNLNIRISKELRTKFYEVAKEQAHNPSALLRKWIEEYVEENIEKKVVHKHEKATLGEDKKKQDN